MDDFLQQSKKQGKLNEGLFNRIFGKKQAPVQSNPDFYQDRNGVFVFGGKSTAEDAKGNNRVNDLQDFQWNESKLRFVVAPETEFHAENIIFDLDKEEISYFRGDWKSGQFIGDEFQGTFSGIYFVGNFMGDYTEYKSEPNTFHAGTFWELSENGILGKENTLTLDNIGDNDSFLLITVPVGYSIQMRSANGIDSSIKVLKRLDEYSSLFKFEVTDGFSGNKDIVDVEWQTIRDSWGKGIYEITKIGAKNVANLVIATGQDYIKEMYVSEAKSTFQSQAAQTSQVAPQVFIPGQKYVFNLSEIPLLNINSIRGAKGKFVGSTKPEATLSFDTQDEFNQFNNIILNFKNGIFKQDLNNISKAIKYGEVDGYGPYRYLSKVFDVQGVMLKEVKKTKKGSAHAGMMNPPINIGASKRQYGQSTKQSKSTVSVQPAVNTASTTISPVPDIKQSMNRLNSFVYYFVENIVTKKGVPNEVAKKIIFDNLKRVIGIVDSKSSVTQPPTTSSTPVVPSTGPGMTSSQIGKAFMPESIRNSVRNIINDSF